MNVDWFQTAAVVALGLSAITGWTVAQHLNIDHLAPRRSWQKRVRGLRHKPKHKPDQVPIHADVDDRRFYTDLYPVADYLNQVYGDSPWSFENNGRLNCKGFDSNAEREIEVWYNQQKTGKIKLSCISYGHERYGGITAQLHLTNGRLFAGNEVVGLAQTVGQIVTGTPEEDRAIKASILTAMVDAMWQQGDEANVNPELELSFEGKAGWYLREYLPTIEERRATE
ncbi:MAG TPA: hypothetical protein VM144_11245 [Aestuariivirga sp.]|nr:hypothetical protein [Aestuariivirga sp.]